MFGKKENTVNVVVGKDGLVAVFEKASPPTVWKFDLARNHSFSLRMKGDEEAGWDLGVVLSADDFQRVAHFADHDEAHAAFDAVQKVLTQKRFGKFWLVVKWLLAAIVLFLVISFGMNALMPLLSSSASLPAGMPIPADMAFAPSGKQAPKAPVAPQAGVPQSADDVLQPPP